MERLRVVIDVIGVLTFGNQDIKFVVENNRNKIFLVWIYSL